MLGVKFLLALESRKGTLSDAVHFFRPGCFARADQSAPVWDSQSRADATHFRGGRSCFMCQGLVAAHATGGLKQGMSPFLR